jgi:phage terminase large subunit-like protein
MARPEQLRPGTPGAKLSRSDWHYWLVQAGRGFGKTRMGAETVREWVNGGYRLIHLVGATAADVRDVMVQGPSGLLSCFPPNERPEYEPSKRLITFPNGAIAKTFSADEPERLRGPACDAFWADELAAWRFAYDAWDNLMFGFRMGDNPQGIVTTTPKPIKLLRDIIADPHTVVTRGSTYANRSNLSASFFDSIIRKYEGTRLGRQEIEAELLEDLPGALWTRDMIGAVRISPQEVRWDLLTRIVVAIDPAVTAGENSDETGIVVVALARSLHVVVLDDRSCRESPLGWARIAVEAYKAYRADRIVGEVNNGGDLVEANIRAVAPEISFRAVRASRGKAVRAEPVAALYEQGRVHHVGTFERLEDQMCSYVPGRHMDSPDRMDALVWGITELLIDPEPTNITLAYGGWYEISPV